MGGGRRERASRQAGSLTLIMRDDGGEHPAMAGHADLEMVLANALCRAWETEQPRSQMNLIDHHEAVVLDEASRIILGGTQRGRIV